MWWIVNKFKGNKQFYKPLSADGSHTGEEAGVWSVKVNFKAPNHSLTLQDILRRQRKDLFQDL